MVVLTAAKRKVVPISQAEPGLHLGLAPYLGDLTKDNIFALDSRCLTTMHLLTDRLAAIDAGSRSWASLNDFLAGCSFLQQRQDFDGLHEGKVQATQKCLPDPTNIANVSSVARSVVSVWTLSISC